MNDFFDFLVSLFNPGIKDNKSVKPPPKSSGITIIPDGLNEVKSPRFKDFDKVDFYYNIKKLYPKNYVTIYQIMALETTHFKSGQFIYTGTGGMEVHKSKYPYGWTSAIDLWKNKSLAPNGYKIFTDGAKRKRAFLAFKSPISFAAYLNLYLNKYRPGRWRSSTNLALQESYEKYISQIKLPTA